MAKVSKARKGQLNGVLKELLSEIREEPLDRKEVWERMWRKDPDGGCTKSTSYNVKLFLTKNWPVLETACGSGRYLRLAKNSFYVGIDVAWEAVRVGAKRNREAN
ncbi:MAG: class I SAM-dependent methyltransferase, partial [Candidatus Micrarchaeota archaeon]|nr:class I SAM-dependent methyltransferase [Candidatus Micrarchaeota archaeon]